MNNPKSVMKHFFLPPLLLIAVSTTAVPTAAQNKLPPEVREMARKVNMPVVYKVPGMDKVKVVQNLKYTATDDPNVFCLIAYSAAGPLLSLGMRGETPFVRCLVGFYAFMDIQQSDYRQTETPETIRTYSPITYLQKDVSKIPPLFIARAGRDEVPTMDDSIDRFVKEALARNIAFTLANHPQGVHGFDNQNDDDRSREIIRGAIAFMQIHLGVTGK